MFLWIRKFSTPRLLSSKQLAQAMRFWLLEIMASWNKSTEDSGSISLHLRRSETSVDSIRKTCLIRYWIFTIEDKLGIPRHFQSLDRLSV